MARIAAAYGFRLIRLFCDQACSRCRVAWQGLANKILVSMYIYTYIHTSPSGSGSGISPFLDLHGRQKRRPIPRRVKPCGGIHFNSIQPTPDLPTGRRLRQQLQSISFIIRSSQDLKRRGFNMDATHPDHFERSTSHTMDGNVMVMVTESLTWICDMCLGSTKQFYFYTNTTESLHIFFFLLFFFFFWKSPEDAAGTRGCLSSGDRRGWASWRGQADGAVCGTWNRTSSSPCRRHRAEEAAITQHHDCH